MPDVSFNLCQPGRGKSCAACCGIYNYLDSAREALLRRLRQRTDRFRADVRGVEDLSTFSRSILAVEDQTRRFAVIHSCEYAGFLDNEEKLVGCLLHPASNGGIDMRDVSFYGRELCSGHICPSYHFLSSLERGILIDLLDDWYLYGLCITDIDLIKDYIRHISDRLERCLMRKCSGERVFGPSSGTFSPTRAVGPSVHPKSTGWVGSISTVLSI